MLSCLLILPSPDTLCGLERNLPPAKKIKKEKNMARLRLWTRFSENINAVSGREAQVGLFIF